MIVKDANGTHYDDVNMSEINGIKTAAIPNGSAQSMRTVVCYLQMGSCCAVSTKRSSIGMFIEVWVVTSLFISSLNSCCF